MFLPLIRKVPTPHGTRLPLGLIRKVPPPRAVPCILGAAQVRQLHTLTALDLGATYTQAAWDKTTDSQAVANLLTEPVRLDFLLIDPDHIPWGEYHLLVNQLQHFTRGELVAMGRRVRAALPPRESYRLPADSPLEESFVRCVLTPAALPGIIPHIRPQYEVPCGGRKYRVDYALLGASHKIAIELDGYAYHSDREAFTADRLRQNELALAGFLILRFTHETVQGDPGRCVAQLQAAMRLDSVLRGYVDSAPRLEAPQNGGRSC